MRQALNLELGSSAVLVNYVNVDDVNDEDGDDGNNVGEVVDCAKTRDFRYQLADEAVRIVGHSANVVVVDDEAIRSGRNWIDPNNKRYWALKRYNYY